MEKSNFECLTLDNVELMYYAINKRHINKSFVELIRLIKVQERCPLDVTNYGSGD